MENLNSKEVVSSKICRNFLKENSCKYGDQCKFLHEKMNKISNSKVIIETICKMYQNNHSCKYGDTCLYKHIIEPRETKAETSDLLEDMDSNENSTKRLSVTRIQRIQKKRIKENTQNDKLNSTRYDIPIRESKKKKTDKSLDEEAYKQKTRKEFVTPEDFFCFRCNIEKKSRYNYEWTTSQGLKIICNGCNGFLISTLN